MCDSITATRASNAKQLSGCNSISSSWRLFIPAQWLSEVQSWLLQCFTAIAMGGKPFFGPGVGFGE
jgi:hypothetical protein